MTPEERDRVFDEMMDDTAKVRREIEAEIRKERPDVTREQLNAEWGLVEATLGLYAPPPDDEPGSASSSCPSSRSRTSGRRRSRMRPRW